MKFLKIVSLCLLFSGLFTAINAQKLHFGTITNNGESLNNIPRFSIGFPFTFDLVDFSENIILHGGGTVKTEGVKFNKDADKLKMRTWTVGPVVNLVFKQKKTLILAGFGLDYNFHYKEKFFPNNNRKDAEVRHKEWNSDRVNRFNHYARLGFGLRGGLYLYGEYFFKEFLNQDFTENVDGISVQPYNGLEINRFNIGISFIFTGDTDDDTFGTGEPKERQTTILK